MVIYVEDTDENSDWIKWQGREEEIRVSEDAKQLLKMEENDVSLTK